MCFWLDRDDGFGSEAQSHLDGGEGGDEKPNTRVEQMLWVEKYAPSHFTQLLSDDVSMYMFVPAVVNRSFQG